MIWLQVPKDEILGIIFLILSSFNPLFSQAAWMDSLFPTALCTTRILATSVAGKALFFFDGTATNFQ
jgi:hypothetical protein